MIKKFNEKFDDFDWDEEEPSEFKSVLTKTEPMHYISTADIIYFIEKNSDMEWNTVCDYVYKKGILNHDGPDFFSRGENYEGLKGKWINGFFKVHPWINQMMVVFDD